MMAHRHRTHEEGDMLARTLLSRTSVVTTEPVDSNFDTAHMINFHTVGLAVSCAHALP